MRRTLILAAALSGILWTVPPPLQAESEPVTEKFTAFGEAYQFVFYSVLEGLYRDGASQPGRRAHPHEAKPRTRV